MLRCLVRCAPAATQVYIYTGDDTPAAELAARAHALFGVPPLRPVQCVRLRCRGAVLAERYPVATLLGQALGSMLLAAEALLRLTPELFIDTAVRKHTRFALASLAQSHSLLSPQGYAFAYPLAAAVGARVAAYTHYPMVSSDMLRAVASRAPSFNNAGRVARSRLLSAAKLSYYRALALLYGAAGRCAHVVMVNSSWTEEHISELWGLEPRCVFPPCDTAALRALPLARGGGAAAPRRVVSVAQFRPEKAHALQLRAWAAMRGRAAMHAAAGNAAAAAALSAATLLLVGGVRHTEDAARLESLRTLASQLGLGDSVAFAVGIPSPELRHQLGSAHIGLHTMRDEHFGISVVEYMAAGCVPIAHDSAGPRADIVVAPTPGGARPGRLADSEAGFADALEEMVLMPEEARLALAAAARAAAGRFSEDAFAEGFVDALRRVLPAERSARSARGGAASKAD